MVAKLDGAIREMFLQSTSMQRIEEAVEILTDNHTPSLSTVSCIFLTLEGQVWVVDLWATEATRP